MDYIPADKLIAEIERLKERYGSITLKSITAQNYQEGRLIGYEDALYEIKKLFQQVQSDNEDIDKIAQELYEHLYELKRRNNVPTNLYDKQEIIDLWKAGVEYGYNHPKQEQPNNMIQWTGSNLQEVIDFTGKSPKFGEWFKSWDEFEFYVHSHGDILKLFSEDGSHFEVPVGAWIVKTPDGHNVPSVARFIHAKQEHPEQKMNFEVKFAEFLERKDAELGAKAWSEEDLRELALYFYYSRNDDEQPEVDLEEELEKWRHDHFKGKRDGDYNGEYLERESQLDLARHFYELRISARKEK